MSVRIYDNLTTGEPKPQNMTATSSNRFEALAGTESITSAQRVIIGVQQSYRGHAQILVLHDGASSLASPGRAGHLGEVNICVARRCAIEGFKEIADLVRARSLCMW